MQLTKVAAVLSLFVALGLGVASVYIADSRKEVAPVASPADFNVTAVAKSPIRLLGTWTGKFGHNLGDCTIEINRYDGNNFYGILRKGGAEIALTGTLDRETRKVSIHETKVLNLGEYGGWSLGEDMATISPDGLWMSGTGRDDMGEYGWTVSQIKSETPIDKRD